ncbi:hypothetical protein K431DRAFT_117119 [Polychaeton citri CBS 116435]|uniref:Uncharacterized protein n=1 Tax=Polychaeton citri CBS 116435 TaxID=1314669 RepID=A0A9P4QG63_9PEZI|nr:hypothetical protein K431DRAFT_117119 [Polychaeton citri CBS 116435]
MTHSATDRYRYGNRSRIPPSFPARSIAVLARAPSQPLKVSAIPPNSLQLRPLPAPFLRIDSISILSRSDSSIYSAVFHYLDTSSTQCLPVRESKTLRRRRRSSKHSRLTRKRKRKSKYIESDEEGDEEEGSEDDEEGDEEEGGEEDEKTEIPPQKKRKTEQPEEVGDEDEPEQEDGSEVDGAELEDDDEDADGAEDTPTDSAAKANKAVPKESDLPEVDEAVKQDEASA